MTIENIIDKIDEIAQKNHIRAELYNYTDYFVTYLIEWGDWKHDHRRFDLLVEQELHPIMTGHEEYESDGSDTFSELHTFLFAIDDVENF